MGKHYRPGGIALVGINPGASAGGGYKEARRDALARFAAGEVSALESYWDALASDAEKHWNPRYLARVRALGLQIDQLLVGNLALCATQRNKYPKSMLRRCWGQHTERFITHFAPGTLILMGSAGTVGEFLNGLQSTHPTLRTARIAHYAHRKGLAYEQSECARVSEFLNERS